MQIDYKKKYQELKLKFKETVNLSYRLGIEEGMRQGQVQQAQQAQASAEQAAQQAAAMGGQQPGQPGQPGDEQNPEQGQPQQMGSDGSELDQHIGQLESMLQKSFPGSSEFNELKKSLDGIKAFKSQLKQAHDMKKAEQAIKSIGKALNKMPFTIGKQALKNMNEPSQKALNMQEQLVQDVMKGWGEEEERALTSVKKTLSLESLIKE